MFEEIVAKALHEDCVFDDITSDLTIPKNCLISFEIKTREQIIFCGKEIIEEVFFQLKKSAKFKNSKLDFRILVKDGDVLKSEESIARGHGDAKLIFAAERVILNFIQHLSGVATTTREFVTKLANKKIKILDTRKTLPGLRDLEKYAVKVGGGKNHRHNLAEMILIKDNHIVAAGGVSQAILAAKKSRTKKIEIECDNFKQVAEAVKSRPDIIMLDNMKVAEIKKCAALIRAHKIKIEVSGGVNLQNIKKFSDLDIDFISVGALTHSARAVDIGLDLS
ncbi:MAG: carboxylating nicotinate-nucleotide diphosphorylase [Proteobacteria bacterium]|nr:carboxylating nicotinate-nucleotide diphosphorylase [Pseudomonadota bacterium]